jgi:ribosomal protein S18 acetylase RimI-like enzyme
VYSRLGPDLNSYSFRQVDFVQDQTILFQIYASTRSEELALTSWTNEQKLTFLQMQFNAQQTYYLENYLLAKFQIIESNHQTIGRLYTSEMKNELRIVDITLLPEFRRIGIGTKILEEIIHTAQKNHQDVTIHVERNNPALKLYLRLGFTITEDKGVYFFLTLPCQHEREEDK